MSGASFSKDGLEEGEQARSSGMRACPARPMHLAA